MKKLNKFVASLLAGTMVFSLVACGNAEGNGNNTTETGSVAATESAAETNATEATTEEAPVEAVKPDKIKVMWDGTVFKEGDNYAEAFYTALAEALDMEIEWVRPDHSGYADNLAIAFNDASTLADVVLLPANYYASYAAQGLLWDMTSAWNNSETANSGRLTSVADQIISGWYTKGADGKEGIYGMYPARGNGCVTYVKATWATAAGYTEDTLPTDWAGYQQFLLDLKEANGGKAPVLSAGLITGEAPFTNYLPEFYQDAYPDFIEVNGEWVDGFSQDSMKAALDRLAWGYSNGVLEASILEGPSTSDVRNKFYDDTTGIFTYWAGTWAYNIKSNLEKNDLDGECWALKPIAELGAYTERYSPMICITSACENPQGVFTYFVDKILDGGDVQMLWQYGVENVHYVYNEDGATITGLATEATAGTEKESKTTKNLFEANLKIGNFAGNDPYVAADPVIDESFALFDANSQQAPKIMTSDVYLQYSADLWTERNQLIAKVTKGEMTSDAAMAEYNEVCGPIVEAILASFNE